MTSQVEVTVSLLGVTASLLGICQVMGATWAVGGRGPNPEYLFKTADMLRDLGIPDPQLDYLAQKVANLTKSA